MEGWKDGRGEDGRMEGWKVGGKWSRRHSLKANEVLGSHPVIQPFLLLDQDQGSGWGLAE